MAVVAENQSLEYRLLLRNNHNRTILYEAQLVPPSGWQTTAQFSALKLEPAGRGELKFKLVSPSKADNVRRLLTAEIKIDGVNQGQICEALMTVRQG